MTVLLLTDLGFKGFRHPSREMFPTPDTAQEIDLHIDPAVLGAGQGRQPRRLGKPSMRVGWLRITLFSIQIKLKLCSTQVIEVKLLVIRPEVSSFFERKQCTSFVMGAPSQKNTLKMLIFNAHQNLNAQKMSFLKCVQCSS